MNGNLQTLHRKGEVEDPNYNVVIDDLIYDYDDGNKLINVTDLVGHSAGFNDGNVHTTTFSDDFEYDDYGNLIKDRNKEIQSVTYNHLQLPVKITFDLGQTIEYKYLADGTKIEKTVTDSQNNSNVTEYREGFQYKNDQLEFFPHAEGYVKAVAAGGESNPGYLFHYVFNYTDHLGNIRLKYTKDPDTGQTKILEENHFYPFGLTHKGYNDEHFIFLESPGTGIQLVPVTPDLTDTYQYKFNGMEYQDEFDINLYDFGARNYDAALGRWMNIDPMAEMMRRHSPYNYAFNNPVYFIDPDGMMPTDSYGMKLSGAFESYGGFDVNTLDSEGNILSSEYHSNINDAMAAAGEIQAGINAKAYQSYFGNVADFAANADVSLGGGGDCGDCGDKQSTLNNTIPCVKCHHTSSIPEGNGKGLNGLLKNRQSGYIQYGGNMRSDFIGDGVGEEGVLYGSVDDLVYPSDNSSKIKLLNYIIKLKGGGEIGNDIIESILKDAEVDIRTFDYPRKEVYWQKRGRKEYKLYRTKMRRGYIINNKDTIK